MLVREHELDINYLEELENFEWVHYQIKGNKFQACSPFRDESRPSFAVNLDTGTWVDSGSSDEAYHKGNIISLLSFLRGEESYETEDYLVQKYSLLLHDTEALQLHLNLVGEKEAPVFISRESVAYLYKAKTDYFTGRGISIEVQQQFGCGYNPDNKAIALLWTDKKGNIANIKYRNTNNKVFFYEKGGQPIKHHVFGLHQVVESRAKRVFLCESEIDALTLWTHGYPAVAAGGSSLSDIQSKLILTSGIEEIVIATDNDKVGHRFRQFLKKEFEGHMIVLDVSFPLNKKDVNELTAPEIKQMCTNLSKQSISFI